MGCGRTVKLALAIAAALATNGGERPGMALEAGADHCAVRAGR